MLFGGLIWVVLKWTLQVGLLLGNGQNLLRASKAQNGVLKGTFMIPSQPPMFCSNSCPLSWWYHPAISSSVVSFSSCPQSFPASESFPMSWLFVSGGQSFGVSASASLLPTNTQGWLPLGLTGLISLQFKGFSRIFSSTTLQKHQFFGTQPSLWSNSHICTWLLEKP